MNADAYRAPAVAAIRLVIAATTLVALSPWAGRDLVQHLAMRLPLRSRAQSCQDVLALLRQMSATLAVDDVAPRLAGQPGVALPTGRLTHELRRQRAELAALERALAASRDRLLTVRRDEQRRVRAEVDDQVVRHLDRALTQVEGADLVAASRASMQALDALRAIARGIYPPRLAGSGLAAALDGWLESADLYAQLEVDDAVPTESATICLYFCSVTALDALASAGARSLRVRLQVDQQAVLTVSGSGAAAGLQPLPQTVRTVIRDRVEAYGGWAAFDAGAVRVAVPLSEER